MRQALIERVPPHSRAVVHREMATALAEAGAPARLVARHWVAGGRPAEAQPWRLAAAREALGLGAYRDALAQLDPLLDLDPRHLEALRLRAEALDAIGSPAAPAAYEAAAGVVGGDEAQDLQAKRALATIKLGDGDGALAILATVEPVSVEGRLAEALRLAGAAALGYADPELGSREVGRAPAASPSRPATPSRWWSRPGRTPPRPTPAATCGAASRSTSTRRRPCRGWRPASSTGSSA